MHRVEPSEQLDDRLDSVGGREPEELHGIERRCGLGGLAPSAPEARKPVGAGAAGSFRDAEEGREERPSKLIGERRVSSREIVGE